MSINVVPLHSRDENEKHPHHVVADNLAAELGRKRMSGRQAAAALNLSVAYVARRVSGDTEMSINDLYAFANLLDIDVAVLLDGANPKPKPAPMVWFPGDNTVGPAGIEPTTSTVKTWVPNSSDHLAEVIPLRGAAA